MNTVYSLFACLCMHIVYISRAYIVAVGFYLFLFVLLSFEYIYESQVQNRHDRNAHGMVQLQSLYNSKFYYMLYWYWSIFWR